MQKGAIEFKTQSDPSDANDVRNVLDLYRQLIARNIHAQMMAHSYEAAMQYFVELSRGLTAVRPSPCTVGAGQPVREYRRVGRRAEPHQADGAQALFALLSYAAKV